MTTQAPTIPPQVATAAAPAKMRRKILLLALGVTTVLAGAGYASYWYSTGRYLVATDDAYVAGHVIQLTPQIAGTVLSVHADDTDFVQAGSVLAQLDPADAQLALERAQSLLAQTVRQTEALYLNQGVQAAAVAQRETEVKRARADLAQRSALKGSGAVSEEEIRHAEDTLRGASAALDASRQQLAASRALAGAGPVQEHPAVAQARAALNEAELALERTRILAPRSGYLARRNVQVGQRVAVGAALAAVVPLDELWVDANFKESQLRHMRIGQAVKLSADLFGQSVVYHGRVVGLSAGTGSAFNLLPAQNATGNWIKVVQRLPVRVALDPAELRAHPLRVGLSMLAEVNVEQQDGAQLAPAQPKAAATRGSAQRLAQASAAR
ncbi:HlyD family efflux transporter periplasmic adaptor subunit [Massilia sp. erpn]|uniref:HlyD family secretion protein n=1 Tax=Massilia sp. erpn TaxID=2738142 RepID=UPI00210479B5|nr:HlyD family efflux transporter periplasmic adaptor subunit [Massilia sp. erpn]UTY56218.1 HlyD family efflux transporter periplasmic adaptor subunit [Massilia sp. erpn]